tara:strand:+ start:158 stop:541 length:384 start_codon:yes stop_codon:yes gene_type:complete
MSNITNLINNTQQNENPAILWPILVDSEFCNDQMKNEQMLSDLEEVQGLITAIAEADRQNISIPKLTANIVEDTTHAQLKAISVKVNSYVDEAFSNLYWNILSEDSNYDYVFSTEDSAAIINATSAG